MQKEWSSQRLKIRAGLLGRECNTCVAFKVEEKSDQNVDKV